MTLPAELNASRSPFWLVVLLGFAEPYRAQWRPRRTAWARPPRCLTWRFTGFGSRRPCRAGRQADSTPAPLCRSRIQPPRSCLPPVEILNPSSMGVFSGAVGPLRGIWSLNIQGNLIKGQVENAHLRVLLRLGVP